AHVGRKGDRFIFQCHPSLANILHGRGIMIYPMLSKQGVTNYASKRPAHFAAFSAPHDPTGA
ncbi:MAG: hypothetical protein V3S24_24585, partial [Candidatus Tectomicrobia bacterium]